MTPEQTRRQGIALALVVAISYGLIRWYALPPPDAPALPLARQDNEIQGVEMRVFDQAGQPSLVLHSPRIVSPRRGDEYLIQTPEFELVSEARGRWQGSSRIGRLDVGQDRLWLEDDVLLKGLRSSGQPVTINGQRIEFRLAERLASSEEAVEIRQPGSELRGVGMRADLKQDRLILRSQVEGVYAPQRKRS